MALLLLLTAGCSMVPAYHRPATGAPAAFTSVAEGAAGVRAAPPAPDWWRGFGSNELADLVQRSLARNNDLQASIARIEEARASARIASAALYPSLGIAGSANASTYSGSTTANGQSGGSGAGLAATASYEIDLFGRYHATSGSARALAAASAFDRDAVALSLTAAVADTYLQLLSLQDRLQFARQIAANADHVLRLIEAQRDVGTATDLQVAQQRNIAATFDAAVPTLQQQFELTRHALALLTGDPPNAGSIAAPGMAGLELPDIAPDLPASLLDRRPDIRAAEARIISANFDVGAARAAFLPSISLTGQGGLESAALAQLLSPAGVASTAASLLAPVFDGGRLKGQLRYDRAHVQELTATYRQTVLGAFRDVEDALSATARLREIERADTEAVTAAEQASKLAQAQFQLGTIDLLTLLDTERSLYSAQDMLLQVRLQRFQAAVALYRALAGGYGDPAPRAVP